MSLADGANVTVKPEIHDEAKEETQALSTKMHDEDIQTEKGLGSTLIQSLEIQKQSLQMLTKISEKEFGGGGSDSGGGGLLDTAADLAGNVMGKGGKLLGRAGGMLKSGGAKLLQFGKAAAIPAAIAAAGAYTIDAGAGALGIGKDEKGNDLQVDEKQDDANWNKMSLGEKAQSGVARGIEKVGSFFFLDNLSRQAQADRVKNETEYLNKKNGVTTGEPTVTKATEKWTEIAGEKAVPGQDLSPKQMAVMGMAIQSGNSYSPEIMAQYNKQKAAIGTGSGAGSSEFAAQDPRRVDVAPSGSSPTVTNGSAIYGESKSNADAAAQTSGTTSSNNIVNAPSNVTNNYSSSSTPRVPPRNQDSSVSRYIGSRYAAY